MTGLRGRHKTVRRGDPDLCLGPMQTGALPGLGYLCPRDAFTTRPAPLCFSHALSSCSVRDPLPGGRSSEVYA